MRLIAGLTLLPLVIVILGLIPRIAGRLPGIAAGLALLQVPVVCWTAGPALWEGVTVSAGDDFGLDGAGGLFAVLTTLIVAAALVQAALLLPAEQEGEHAVSDRRLGFFYTLAGLFLLAMYGVIAARNLGYLWIAMEATTLMSAPLVYFHRSRNSLEATWKYLLLCSVGIAFALFGTVLIFAASQPPGEGGGTLVLDELQTLGPALHPNLLRLGFIFCLLGYGTKAGLFPLHNWLPDAHSEAPAPASAMLSGSLLNCALLALWRLSQVMVSAGQEPLVRALMVPAGALTVFAAGLMLVRQHDLKRMWAYSSVEHVGLMALAIGLDSGPLFLLHAVNHSLVKAALFLLAGNVLHLYGTKAIAKLGGLLRVAPAWAILLAAGTFAVAGSPPFGTFLSEWLILQAAVSRGEAWAAVAVMVGLTITFGAVASHLGRILFGPGPRELAARRAAPARSAAPAALLSLSLVAGLALAPPVLGILDAWTRQGGFR